MTTERATAEGTARYAERFRGPVAEGHYRNMCKLSLSSIGLGTYLGDPDERTDRKYQDSVEFALENGCNFLDTAINYRFQRSERSIGAALKASMERKAIGRDEVLISTKGGFLSFDGDYPANPAKYFLDEYIEKGLCTKDDIVANCHCMTPRYLENQVQRSLKNLQLECLDVYLIHNPETQLTEVPRQEFLKRMRSAFQTLETRVELGQIAMYGVATWDGLRHNPQAPGYLSLEELIELAREIAGDNHHFRAVQLPYNLAMPEAFVSRNQKLGSKWVSLLEAAAHNQMMVMCSASILQGQLARHIPEGVARHFQQLRSDAQRSIQFVRSTPGVTTALVGMSSKAHVEENLQTASVPPLPWDRLKELFSE